jgi:hypothetical protein
LDGHSKGPTANLSDRTSSSKAGSSFESGNPFPGKGTLFAAFLSLYKIAPLETIIPHPWHEPCYQPNPNRLNLGAV